MSCVFSEQKTAYELRISDWSSDVCSSDLDRIDHPDAVFCETVFIVDGLFGEPAGIGVQRREPRAQQCVDFQIDLADRVAGALVPAPEIGAPAGKGALPRLMRDRRHGVGERLSHPPRSEEHTSELQSLMRNSYAVFCLKK